MTFKEQFERYRSGDATPEERQTVEAELEKFALLSDHLYGTWEEPQTEPPAGELKQVKKSLRRRNVTLVLTSVVLVIAMLLSVPMVERVYFDPGRQTTSSATMPDLGLALECYYELFAPEQDFVFISNITDTGFAKWNVELCFYNWGDISMHSYLNASVEKNEIRFPRNTLTYVPTDHFNMGPLEIPVDSAGYDSIQEIRWHLADVDDDTSIYAAISFNADLSAEELFDLMDQYGLIVRWAGVRAGQPYDPLTPLIGMKLDGHRADCGINADYPDFAGYVSEYNAERHFRSMVEYLRDYEQNTMNIGVIEDPDYYDKVLAELDEGGLRFYGAYVTANARELRAMAENGDMTDIRVLRIQENMGYAYMAPSFGG